MENKLTFVRNNGVIRLPPGFRFHPTDEELVVQYLRRKAFACPLPASIIPEVDICKFEPWDLPGNLEQERYFFSTREAKYRNGNRPNRATGSGYWKATGLDKRIVASKCNQVVGMKKTLVFYRGKPSKASKTDWIMHEYRLVDAGKSSTEKPMMEEWVICRIFPKKRSTKNGEDIAANSYSKKEVLDLTLGRPSFIDFMNQDKIVSNPSSSSSSSSSASASSGITEATSPESYNDDNNSCNSKSSSSCRREP
ncbi:Nac domain [Thalictrum thalictroides]|uniref:Nac domain n=1 Tax=Thalictrum thalictroides TaxID=46969 RepID=A0A7J6WLH9_THATH|nr:Nac domain [Thalictrum thalictroides]